MSRFVPEVEQLLRLAGWFPGRRIEDARIDAWASEIESPEGFRMTPAARRVLSEFGGLHVKPQTVVGRDRARSDIKFNPRSGIGEEIQITDWLSPDALGRGFFPIGAASKSYLVCAVDSAGGFYAWFDGMHWKGEPFDQALEQLLLGIDPTKDVSS
ncbi:MAG: SUKH-3 domain-containing protein [Bacteroidota bacterium]